MPRPHISMRKIRDLLRLCLGEGRSIRQAAASVEMPFTTVSDHLRRAKAAGLTWPLPDGLDDDDLESMLFSKPPSPAQVRPMPDWKKIHVELRRPHVTLMLLWIEYREAHPDGYAYSQFCELYRRWRRGVDLVMRQEHKAGPTFRTSRTEFPSPIRWIRSRRWQGRRGDRAAVTGAA